MRTIAGGWVGGRHWRWGLIKISSWQMSYLIPFQIFLILHACGTLCSCKRAGEQIADIIQ